MHYYTSTYKICITMLMHYFLCLDAYFIKHMHYFKVFGCIIMQSLITTEIIENIIINTYKIEVFG